MTRDELEAAKTAAWLKGDTAAWSRYAWALIQHDRQTSPKE
jgi:hypothetical protein